MYGSKKRVREGDILLCAGVNVEVIYVEVGKFIIFRSVNDTRCHGKVKWDSPQWKRDPFYRKRESDREKEEQKLLHYLRAHGLPLDAPYRWSSEYQAYKIKKKQLIQSFNEENHKPRKKKSKKQSSQNPKPPKPMYLPNVSVLDYVKEQKGFKIGVKSRAHLPRDPYSDSVVYHSFEEFGIENETHEEYIKRLKESNSNQNHRSADNNRIERFLGLSTEEEQSDLLEEWNDVDPSESANGWDNTRNDTTHAFEKEIEQEYEKNEPEKKHWEKQDENEENEEDEEDEIYICDTVSDSSIEDVSAFQVPSQYNSNGGDELDAFHVESNIHKAIQSNSGRFQITAYQQQLLDANHRIDNDNDTSIFFNTPSAHSQYSFSFIDESSISPESRTFSYSATRPPKEEEQTPTVVPRNIYFDLSAVQPSHQVHFFEGVEETRHSSFGTLEESELGEFFSWFDSDSDSGEPIGEMALLFE